MKAQTHEHPGVPEWIAGNYEPFTLTDMQRIADQMENFFPKEMDVLRQAGVHPTDHALRSNPYTSEMDDEVYFNVGQHCVAVGYAASLIANLIFPGDQEKIDLATSHGITHNASKGMEIMRKKAAKLGKFTTDPYAVSAYEMVGQVLAGKGLSPEFLEYLKNSGRETGHTSLVSFLTVDMDRPRTGEDITTDRHPELVKGREIDKIVHLADDVTWTARKAIDGYAPTYYLPIEGRMTAQDFPQTYPFLYMEGIAFDQSGKSVLVTDFLGDHKDPQNIVSPEQWQEWAKSAHPELDFARTYAQYQVWEAREMSFELVTNMPVGIRRAYDYNGEPHEFMVNHLNSQLKEKHNYFRHIRRISITS